MTIQNNDGPNISRQDTLLQNLDQTQQSLRSNQTAGANSASSTVGADATPGDDSISLSNTPNLVQQALASPSSARLARIAELKALVQNNQYLPDATEVSQALVNAHLSGG